MERFFVQKRIIFWLFAFLTAHTAYGQDPIAVAPGGGVANEAAEPPPMRQGLQRERSSSVATSSISAQKRSSPQSMTPTPYGQVELRHSINDYYGRESGRREKRTAAMYGKLLIGSRFYGDMLDVSASVGATKTAGTQRTYQKRPEVTVDFFPITSPHLNVMTYGSAQFPVRMADLDPTEFADSDRYDQDSRRSLDATVITFGIAPNARMDGSFTPGRMYILVGGDAWTKTYSKPQYVTSAEQDGSIGLVQSGEPTVAEPFEDRAMRYVHQECLEVGLVPSIFPRMSMDLAGYVESRYLPRYFRSETTGQWDYVYEPERISFMRAKIGFDLGQRTTLTNEFYAFRNGVFAENRVNDQRRYRNIVRLAVKL